MFLGSCLFVGLVFCVALCLQFFTAFECGEAMREPIHTQGCQCGKQIDVKFLIEEADFQELKELEEQETKEALELEQRKHKLIKWKAKGKGQGPYKGRRRQEQQVLGPKPTTIPPFVRAHLPWPLTQTKQCLLPPGWSKRWITRCPNHLELRWQKGKGRDWWSTDLEVIWRSWKS